MATVKPATASEPRTLTVQLDGHDDVSLDKSVRDALKSMDMDGDGTVTLPELLSMLQSKKNAEEEASRLRTYLTVAVVLYAFTLAAIFGVALGANSLLKDAYTSGGVTTSSNGMTIAQPKTFYSGEADLQDLLQSTVAQLDSVEEIDFELPAGQIVRFQVASYIATPSEDVKSWEDVELMSPTGMTLFISDSEVSLFLPGSEFRNATFVDLLEESEEDSSRRLQRFGQNGRGRGSFRQSPQNGMPPPPRSQSQSDSEEEESSDEGGSFGSRGGGRSSGNWGPGLAPCSSGGFCPEQRGGGFGGSRGGSFEGSSGGNNGNGGPAQQSGNGRNGMTGATPSRGGGRGAPSGGVGRPSRPWGGRQG